MSFGLTRSPRNILFGSGQRAALPGYVRDLGTRLLIVTDERFSASREFAEIADALGAAGIETRVFDKVAPELPHDCIEAGRDAARAFGAEVILGIGGGSCLDCAKVVALLQTHGGKASDYYGEFAVPGPVVPVIAMPTTSGTGSEATPVAVLADPDRALKVGIASPHLIPHTAICDPELTLTAPAGLTAISGADALVHAIEAFTTRRQAVTENASHSHVFVGKNALSDHHALEAMTLISRALPVACRDGSDLAAREDLMLGALLAGLAFGAAGTSVCHAVQYPVGAETGTPHGLGVAVMLPYALEFNRGVAQEDILRAGRAMGLGPDTEGVITGLERLLAEVGIPASLAALGLRAEAVDRTAELSMAAARLIKNNPRPVDPAGMRDLVRAAFAGRRADLARSNSAALAESGPGGPEGEQR